MCCLSRADMAPQVVNVSTTFNPQPQNIAIQSTDFPSQRWSPMALQLTDLPTEILHHIVRLATYDPVSDTPMKPIDESQSLSQPMYANYTKLALCLVCKQLLDVSVQFLFESIRIVTIHRIPSFVSLLRRNTFHRHSSDARPSGLSFGWWCRRLEISFGLSRLYEGDMWDGGHHTLWGLIPSCPRLAQLIVDINYRDSNPHYMRGTRFIFSTSFFQNIVSMYSTTLTVLDIRGPKVHMRTRDVERTLRCLPHLRVCNLSGVDEQLLDGAESNGNVQDIPFGFEEDVIDAQDLGFDADMLDEFRTMYQTSKWPVHDGKLVSSARLESEPVVSPLVHTISIHPVSHLRTPWHTPSLEKATLQLSHSYQETLDVMQNKLARTFRILPNLPAVRDLTCNGTASALWLVMNSFTGLTRFAYSCDGLPGDIAFHPNADYARPKPQPDLVHIGLYSLWGKDCLRVLVDAITIERFPRLHTIDSGGITLSKLAPHHRQKLQLLGITLT